jgi:hypothetical protein
MEPKHLERHLTGAGSVARRSRHDDPIRLLRQRNHRRSLIYIRMPAPPWRYSTPVTQQRGVRGTLFVLLGGARPRASIGLFESVKKATGLRAIRETIGLECDKSEAHLERVHAKACSVPHASSATCDRQPRCSWITLPSTGGLSWRMTRQGGSPQEIFLRRESSARRRDHARSYSISPSFASSATLNACAAKLSASAPVQASSSTRSATFQWPAARYSGLG